jgi:hypothetical protein
MSASLELHDVVVARLKAAAGVTAIVGNRVYDNVPRLATMPYVSIGPSYFTPEDPDGLTLREETLQVDCWSRIDGRRSEIKNLTDAVKAALHRHSADMGVHALVSMDVVLVRVIDDPDGITRHGVVQVVAQIEEN